MPADSLAWLNGRFLPLQEASLSIFDAGVTTGASVAERLRTFRHEPFLLDEHLARLGDSANAAYVRLREPTGTIRSIVLEVVQRNATSVSVEQDLVVSIFATAGVADSPTLCVTASPIPAADYADSYETGVTLTVPPTMAMPADVISPQIKTRNRLHWHIADRQADELDRGARALLVDQDGFVTETASGNLFIVRGRKLLTPRRKGTLHGISQAYVMTLASDQNLETTEANFATNDVLHADEAFLTSSVYCMLPAVRLNRCGIGDGRPGATYRRLLAAWSDRVGVDIAAQMMRMP
jgi:branched-subunit amino acid aminotransferase/4-amino-4-deoxychorismate lyase